MKTDSPFDINRIKVEFKGMISGILPTIPCNINRIKVEFKDARQLQYNKNIAILIESKWNLKFAGLKSDR